jgi:hypothetical protein
MATFKELTSADIKSHRSFLHQIIDVVQEDVSGSTSRRKYQTFVTGGVGPGVTSSLFQTVHDQDFTLQTANPLFDVTFGLYHSGSIVASSQTGTDALGKALFPSSSLMMREKTDAYRQHAGVLLGDTDAQFVAPMDSTSTDDAIDCALFIDFKRLVARDGIKRETFAMRFAQTASVIDNPTNGNQVPNLSITSTSGVAIFTDVGSALNKTVTFGGQVGSIVDAAQTSRTVGLLFYDRGMAVLDMEKITSGSQFVSGTIDAMSALGTTTLGGAGTETVQKSRFIPDFVVSASMDNVIDHVCAARFQSGSQSAIVFQNQTTINSTLVFCRVDPDEFNYSSNPSYTDSDGRIVVIDPGQEDTQQSFTFITSVGLYDANDNLLAVGKLSRPVENNSERSPSFRLRLDF